MDQYLNLINLISQHVKSRANFLRLAKNLVFTYKYGLSPAMVSLVARLRPVKIDLLVDREWVNKLMKDVSAHDIEKTRALVEQAKPWSTPFMFQHSLWPYYLFLYRTQCLDVYDNPAKCLARITKLPVGDGYIDGGICKIHEYAVSLLQKSGVLIKQKPCTTVTNRVSKLMRLYEEAEILEHQSLSENTIH